MNENMAEMTLQQVGALVNERCYNSARQKLVQMQSLYPSMHDRIGSILTLCEVLSSANLSPLGCDADHYWVLNALPLHSLSRITTHYNHVLESLRLLEAEFPAARLAIELVERAFSVISDRQKRLRFDHDRNASSECRSQDYYNFEADRGWPGCAEEGQIWAADFRTSSAHGHKYGRVSFDSIKAVPRVTWLRPIPVSGSERSWCDSGLPVSCGTFESGLETDSSEPSWPAVPSHRCDYWVRGVLENQFEIYPRSGEVWAIYEDWNIDEWAYCGPDILKQCRFELVEIASDFSKYTGAHCAYLEKVDGFGSIFQRKKRVQGLLHVRPGMFYMFSHKVPAYKFTGGEIAGVLEGMFELDRAALPDRVTINNADTTEKIESPRKKFSKIFICGQIWTVRSGNDQMPRKYARIDRVVSDLQVRATFLEPLITFDRDSNSDIERTVATGLFKASSADVGVEASQLAHIARCRQRSDPFYEINPTKGEVWAMYKNWNRDWKRRDYEASEFQVVLILSDSSEGDGTKIARLEEVNGYLTFFRRRCDGFDLTSIVTEPLSFSHRILAFRVPEIGRLGVQESIWHLEPTALPPYRRFRV